MRVIGGHEAPGSPAPVEKEAHPASTSRWGGVGAPPHHQRWKMSTMTPLEEVTAALDRLKRLRDTAAPFPWKIDPDDYTELEDGSEIAIVSDARDSIVAEWTLFASASLIVTLNRTIDIQMAMLDDAVHDIGAGYEQPYVLDLARAINGSVP